MSIKSVVKSKGEFPQYYYFFPTVYVGNGETFGFKVLCNLTSCVKKKSELSVLLHKSKSIQGLAISTVKYNFLDFLLCVIKSIVFLIV